MKINALSIGEKWLPFQQTGTEYFFTVHSVFNRVINIKTDRELLSIVACNTGGSSSFLSLADREVNFGVAAGERCVSRSGQLCLAEHRISFINAPLWKGPIYKEYRYNKIKKENIEAFKAVLDRKAAPQSAWRYINSESESRFSGLRAIQKLRGNPSLVKSLIGLGQGLTPAGDDMLVGFLAMVNHVSGNGEFVRMLHSAVADSLHRTVDISAQILDNALDCDYHEYIQNCIRDLCEGEKEEVYISAASLMSIGATSGSDIACGMYFGMIDN